MTTLNLSPKNPIVVIALAGAAIWFLSRRTVNGATAQPAPVGSRTVNGTIAPALEALRGIVGIFSSPTGGSAYGVPDEAARAAVRAGDPYYGGAYSMAGIDADWIEQMSQDYKYAPSGGSTGDPYNPDGGYWLN